MQTNRNTNYEVGVHNLHKDKVYDVELISLHPKPIIQNLHLNILKIRVTLDKGENKLNLYISDKRFILNLGDELTVRQISNITNANCCYIAIQTMQRNITIYFHSHIVDYIVNTEIENKIKILSKDASIFLKVPISPEISKNGFFQKLQIKNQAPAWFF